MRPIGATTVIPDRLVPAPGALDPIPVHGPPRAFYHLSGTPGDGGLVLSGIAKLTEDDIAALFAPLT